MPEAPALGVDVVLAWPRRHVSRHVRLAAGATVSDAVAAACLPGDALASVVAFAIHGERVPGDAPVADGDRVELLRALQADPKDARRLRAERQRGRGPGAR